MTTLIIKAAARMGPSQARRSSRLPLVFLSIPINSGTLKFQICLASIYTENMRNGVNLVNYDAPLAIYFYGSPYTDPADPIIAATYAMITAETLGLGTCMLGGVHPLIQSGKKAKLFREMQEIKYASREGLFVVFGYPQVKYKKGIRRTFASVEIKK